jgi:hypothetical protein
MRGVALRGIPGLLELGLRLRACLTALVKIHAEQRCPVSPIYLYDGEMEPGIFDPRCQAGST